MKIEYDAQRDRLNLEFLAERFEQLERLELQWGGEAEVLKPESLRRELQETAKRLLTLYGGIKYDGDKTQE